MRGSRPVHELIYARNERRANSAFCKTIEPNGSFYSTALTFSDVAYSNSCVSVQEYATRLLTLIIHSACFSFQPNKSVLLGLSESNYPETSYCILKRHWQHYISILFYFILFRFSPSYSWDMQNVYKRKRFAACFLVRA